jgi:hypothetical protein
MNNEAYGFKGLSNWLDAATNTNTTTNLSAITYWNDKISNISFTQNTAANQPRYLSSDANFNNLPSIDFYDINRYLTADTGKGMTKTATTAVVCKINAFVTQRNIIMADTVSPALAFYYAAANSSPVFGQGVRSAGIGDEYTNADNNTNSHIIIFSNSNIVVNGVVTKTVSQKLDGQIYNRIGWYTANGNSMNGQIAEIITFNTEFTSINMIALSDRINTKYAIY